MQSNRDRVAGYSRCLPRTRAAVQRPDGHGDGAFGRINSLAVLLGSTVTAGKSIIDIAISSVFHCWLLAEYVPDVKLGKSKCSSRHRLSSVLR